MQLITEIQESDTIEQKPMLGIDFGTTHSLVAIIENNQTKVLCDKYGRYLIPSAVQITKDNIKVIRDNNTKNAHITSVKRFINMSFDDIKKQNLYLKNLEIKNNIENKQDPITLIHEGRSFSLIDVISTIISYLKEIAVNHLGSDVKDAIITVPAYFDSFARGQIINAAAKSNLNVIRLIAEPTAAAYSYHLQDNKLGYYMVYDLGGGTFDVSILHMEDKILQVVSVGGDNNLGGDNIDELIANFLSKKYSLQNDSNLLYLSKSIKHHLSNYQEYQDIYQSKNIYINIQEFHEIISSIIDRTINICMQTLYNNSSSNKLDGIILAGGSTRIPIISTKLKQSFNTKILSDLDPDLCIVKGAAMQAQNLSSQSSSLLLDVNPLSLGIELYGGLVEKIITANTPLPYITKREFTTWADYQTGMLFNLVQGEREMAKDCISLARFELNNLPTKKSGMVKVYINFALDNNGILSITAVEPTSSITHSIEINPTKNLDDQKIQQYTLHGYQNSKEDFLLKQILEVKLSLEKAIMDVNKLINSCSNLIPADNLQKMELQTSNAKSILKSCEEVDKLEKELKTINDISHRISKQYLNNLADKMVKGKNIQDFN